MKINPFATRYVQPGAIPWLGEGAHDLVSLVKRFETQCQRRAAIVGPHGTGKSTLLEHLVPRLGIVTYRVAIGAPTPQADNRWLNSASSVENALMDDVADQESPDAAVNRATELRPTVWLSLRRGPNMLAEVFRSVGHWQPNGLVVVDGFEQLYPPLQWLLRAAARVRHQALLVTTHRPTTLPVLIKTHASVSSVEQIILHAFQNAGLPMPKQYTDSIDIESILEQSGGNVRELLMSLYDHHKALEDTGKPVL